MFIPDLMNRDGVTRLKRQSPKSHPAVCHCTGTFNPKCTEGHCPFHGSELEQKLEQQQSDGESLPQKSDFRIRQNPLTTCECCEAEMRPRSITLPWPQTLTCALWAQGAALQAAAPPRQDAEHQRTAKGHEHDKAAALSATQRVRALVWSGEACRRTDWGFGCPGLGEGDHFGLTQQGTTLVSF